MLITISNLSAVLKIPSLAVKDYFLPHFADQELSMYNRYRLVVWRIELLLLHQGMAAIVAKKEAYLVDWEE